jgi:hypothetical protein
MFSEAGGANGCPDAVASRARGDGQAKTILDVILWLSLFFYMATTASYVQVPLLDQHAFRQCQTAISVPWLAADLDPRRMLVYETPILGVPWRVPFEFPLYQWLAAVLVRVTGWNVGFSCRLVSAAFHLACLWPLWRIVRASGCEPRLWKIMASLFLLAPVLHHWSRAALIETTAVYLSLEYLALMVAWSQRRSLWALAGAAVFAALAVLVKVTTFPPFAMAAGLSCLCVEWQRFRADRRAVSALGRLMPAALPLVIALAFLVPWLKSADAVKLLNPITASMTSTALGTWNYGTLLQKLSAQLWIGTILLRAIPEAIGWPGLLVFIAGMAAVGRRAKFTAAVLVGLFIIPFLMFTNLHMVHNYYQVANALWLVAALAVVVNGLYELLPRTGWIGVVLLCLCGQVHHSMQFYLPMERMDFSRDARMAVAESLKAGLGEGDVAVFLGFDWSPEIAFYAERRAIYIPQWVSYEDVIRIVGKPDMLTGGRRIGAVVVWNNSPCLAGDPRWDQRTTEPLIGWAKKIAEARPPVQIGDFFIFPGF